MTLQRQDITPLVFCIIGNIVSFILTYSEYGVVKFTWLQMVAGIPLLILIVRIIRSSFRGEKP